jgi:hypothetical protein
MAIQFNGVNEVNDRTIRIHTEINRNKWWVAIQRYVGYPKSASGRAHHHAAPNKKGNAGRRKTGGAGRQSVVPAARLYR